MTTYYFDTSATVKRYVTEPGTADVDEVLDATRRGRPRHTIAFVSVGVVEVAATFSRLERMGAISALQWDGLSSQFNADLSSRFLTLDVTKSVVQEAAVLIRRRGLRGYDAVHLGAALTLRRSLRESGLNAPVFVSADAALCSAAEDEGLQVMEPGRP